VSVTPEQRRGRVELHIPEGHERGEEMSRAQRALYGVVRAALVVVGRTYFRARIVGAEHIPATGPFIISPSHRSNLDTPMLGIVTRRCLRYMGKESLWTSRWGGWFLSSMGGFPVQRGSADRDALRAAIRVLERGEPLVMFPEGTRRTGPVIEPGNMHDGPAYVACRTGAPIVPVGMAGTEAAMPKGSKLIRPVRLAIVVRPPIRPTIVAGTRVPRRVVRELTEELRVEIQLAFDEARRLAGYPDGY